MCLGSLADGFLLYFMSKIKILFGNVVEKILIFFMFSDYFYVLITKIIFKNKKNIILMHF
jgi:hypothetical protein